MKASPARAASRSTVHVVAAARIFVQAGLSVERSQKKKRPHTAMRSVVDWAGL